MEWFDYADNTRVQKKTDGAVHYIYKGASHDVQQYSEMPDGTEITYFNDGRRHQKFKNGTILEVAVDKTRKQTNPDGVSIETHPNGFTLQTNPNGSTLETFPDSELLEIEFPLRESPGGEQIKWPSIKRVQKSSTSTHYVSPDATDIQVDGAGSMIVRWAAGSIREADEHYAETGQQWCMKVDTNGETNYLVKEGVEVDAASGQESTSWGIDTWWQTSAEEKAAAQRAEEERIKQEKQAAADRERKLQEDKEQAARDKAAAAAAAKEAREQAARDKAAADAAAQERKAAAERERQQKQMEADLERVAQEQRKAAEEKERQAAANRARLAKEAEDIAKADEAAQRKYYTEKYKLYPFIKFKNFLKKNGIAKAEVDHCLDKYNLKKLAEKHGVEIPDDPKDI
jgi:hypothetical protein